MSVYFLTLLAHSFFLQILTKQFILTTMKDFTALVTEINSVHQWFSSQAARQVNTALTLRNWMFGMYIKEYEQNGQDRAGYGEKLLITLVKALNSKGIRGLTDRYLRGCRSFYEVYPQIWMTLSSKFQCSDNQHLMVELNFENTVFEIPTRRKSATYNKISPARNFNEHFADSVCKITRRVRQRPRPLASCFAPTRTMPSCNMPLAGWSSRFLWGNTS